MCTWPTKAPISKNLGYLHGVSGITHALFEAHAVCDDEQFLKAATGGIAYTDNFFVEDKQNWQDLRCQDNFRLKQVVSNSWASGAAGIALSRARAFEVTKDCNLLDKAMSASHSILNGIRRSLLREGGDFSLGHGMGGLATVLESMPPVAGFAQSVEVAKNVRALGFRTYHVEERPWPCAVHCGTTPGYMTGLAGIGAYYLKSAKKETSCLLLAG